jgi:succinyl-diaminopimelate desuccinylase
MSRGAPNTAERLRARLQKEFGVKDEVPVDVLRALSEERGAQVAKDVERIAEMYASLGEETPKLGAFLQHAREDALFDPNAPVRFRPHSENLLDAVYPDKTSEILDLACQLIRIPSVTASPQERLDEVRRAATFIYDYLRNHGVGVRYYDGGAYPAVLAGFPGEMNAPVMLAGHFDVVEPEPDDSQFQPRVEGDYLWGRGAADMKTVVATYLVWLKDAFQKGPPYPQVNLLLVGNEENGESEPMGTPHVLRLLTEESGYAPQLFIAGERTGERGDERWGEICIQNRGVMRFDVVARGQRGHTGTPGASLDLSERLLNARQDIARILESCLTLESPDGWRSQARFPFIQVGQPGIYNITADYGVLGVEVRPIPQDDLLELKLELEAYCAGEGLALEISVIENGIACDPDNPYLQVLIQAVRTTSGHEPVLGRKLPGTSARFAPGGQGVVWGQSGLSPHARDERHYIPSILPYYRALDELGSVLRQGNEGKDHSDSDQKG